MATYTCGVRVYGLSYIYKRQVSFFIRCRKYHKSYSDALSCSKLLVHKYSISPKCDIKSSSIKVSNTIMIKTGKGTWTRCVYRDVVY